MGLGAGVIVALMYLGSEHSGAASGMQQLSSLWDGKKMECFLRKNVPTRLGAAKLIWGMVYYHM
jgi:hypothetical protein